MPCSPVRHGWSPGPSGKALAPECPWAAGGPLGLPLRTVLWVGCLPLPAARLLSGCAVLSWRGGGQGRALPFHARCVACGLERGGMVESPGLEGSCPHPRPLSPALCRLKGHKCVWGACHVLTAGLGCVTSCECGQVAGRDLHPPGVGSGPCRSLLCGWAGVLRDPRAAWAL